MTQSEHLDKLAAALCAVQATLRGAVKGSVNPHFKNRYADLESVIEAVRGPLAQHGLSFAQVGSFIGGEPALRTMLLHSSGQWLAGDYPLRPAKTDPQGYGAAMTYARRYCLAALLGLPQVDDDGETASGRGETHAPKQSAAKPTAPAPATRLGADLIAEVEAQFGGPTREWFLSVCRAKGYLKEGQSLRELDPMDAKRALKNAEALKAQFDKESKA